MTYRFLCLALCACLWWSPAIAAAESRIPLERLILQQHLTQVELERNLTLLKAEEKELLTEMARLEVELDRQALIMKAMRDRAGEVVRAYYTGERASLLTLVLDTRSFDDLLLILDFLAMLFEQDMDKLERFHTEQAKRKQLQQEKATRLAQVQQLRRTFEEQLAKMLAIQAEKERNLAKIEDPTSVEALMNHLVADWKQRGLPAFHRFFGQLTEVMPQITELVSPERMTSEGLFKHTLTIGEDDFNRFLSAKHEEFRQLTFHFDDDQLIVDGSYDQMNFRLVGAYELVSPKELKFHIRELLFDGFLLPESTVKEMEQTYDLGFYPSLIAPHVEVEGISLDDRQLKLDLTVDFPFLLPPHPG